MATEIVLPKLGMNTETVTIVAWRKNVGDAVALGDVLADIETEKATIELEAEASGILRRHLAEEGTQVAIHQAIAILGTADEDITALEEQLRQQATAPAASHTHVESIYDSWRTRPAEVPATANIGGYAANGHATLATAPPASTVGASAISPAGNLDANAIRARLAERGVLPPTQTTKKRIVIYGSGLGARQLLEITRQLHDIEVVGIIDDNALYHGTVVSGLSVLGGIATLHQLASQGSIDGVSLSFHSEVRKKVHQRLRREVGIPIVSLVDPRAIVGADVTVGDGALIEAGAVVGPGTTVGEGTIVDVGAVVAHDCYLGAFSHLSPGCVLSGVVHLTENVLVGVGAALNSTITVGRNVIITPGAAVMNDLADDVIVGGVPAKVIGTSRRGPSSE